MRRRHGFTLVELLVVIAIITLLIAMLLPVLNKAMENARSAVCASNERQIYVAFVQYVNDNRSACPLPGRYYDPGSGAIPSLIQMEAMQFSALAWCDYTKGTLWPYIGRDVEVRQRLMMCPSDVDAVFRDSNLPGSMHQGGTSPRNFSYSLNVFLWGPRTYTWSHEGYLHGIRFTDIRDPASKILIAEEIAPDDGAFHFNVAATGISRRHLGYSNQCFADGHVELMWGMADNVHILDIGHPPFLTDHIFLQPTDTLNMGQL